MRIVAVTSMKNEGAFLLEWLAHHKGVGFTDFLVFSNDCTDGTDAMLDRLDAMGELTHLPNPGPYHESGVQWTAFKRADRHELVRSADWLMTLDVDEFVNIHAGDHTVYALFDALPEADAIPLTWRLFGNAGVVRFQDRPITETFTRAAPAKLNWPWRAAMFKTLWRNNGAYKKLGVHRPRAPVADKADRTRWFDGSGRALPSQYRRDRIFSPFGQDNYQIAQLNHYALGAMESFVVKRDRGRVNRESPPIGLDYWTERNWCQAQDTSIRAAAPLAAPHLARYHADPELARLHAEAVAWRKARFQALMAEDEYRALFGRLLMAPPAREIPPQLVQELIGYARKAHAAKQ
ncbi:MAG: glycosyl transferase family 2 [Rhodobacterales bacterium]|nr:MAG: glycosyl transferase family 2 [Rhodobacterales bacterium]